ncbi:hypothetical protein BJX76DRAFT_363239 [Aspergillus varians]
MVNPSDTANSDDQSDDKALAYSDDPIAEFKRYGDEASWAERVPYHLLSPRRFAALAQRGHLAARRGYHCLPVLMRMICLRRDMGHPVDPRDHTLGQIGQDIPPMRIMTYELRHPKWVQALHDIRYFQLVEKMRSGPKDKSAENGAETTGEPGDSVGFADWEALRRLAHLSFCPKLDAFTAKVGKSRTWIDSLAKYMDRQDLGFSLFWSSTRKERGDCVPANRLGEAHYLMSECPKLRLLLDLMFQEGMFISTSAEKPRFLIFCQWPLVLWYASMFLHAISVPFVSIRSSMNESARAQAKSAFTDPNSNISVLITTYAVGAHGLNLQGACSHVVLLEPALNLNTLIQALGRIHRIGQKLKQKAFILFQDQSISRWFEYNSLRKAMADIAGQLYTKLEPILNQEQDKIFTRHQLKPGDEITNEALKAMIDERIEEMENQFIGQAVDKHLQDLLGQPRSCLAWADTKILRDEDIPDNADDGPVSELGFTPLRPIPRILPTRSTPGKCLFGADADSGSGPDAIKRRKVLTLVENPADSQGLEPVGQDHCQSAEPKDVVIMDGSGTTGTNTNAVDSVDQAGKGKQVQKEEDSADLSQALGLRIQQDLELPAAELLTQDLIGNDRFVDKVLGMLGAGEAMNSLVNTLSAPVETCQDSGRDGEAPGKQQVLVKPPILPLDSLFTQGLGRVTRQRVSQLMTAGKHGKKGGSTRANNISGTSSSKK